MASRSTRVIQAEFSGAFFIGSFDNKAVPNNARCSFRTLQAAAPSRKACKRRWSNSTAAAFLRDWQNLKTLRDVSVFRRASSSLACQIGTFPLAFPFYVVRWLGDQLLEHMSRNFLPKAV